MRQLDRKASKVLDVLTAHLEIGGIRRIDNSAGTFMPVTVERLTSATFSITHYYKQNGDLVPDPDMMFLKGSAGDQTVWTPVSIQHATGHYSCSIEIERDRPVGYRPKVLADLVRFANMWMRNIADQQGGLQELGKNSTEPAAGHHPE
jgi:hypothetical protein